jgi:hypothetical protein
VGGNRQSGWMSGEALAGRCDALLGEVNREYKSKRDSNRLGPVRFVHVPIADFVNRVGGARHRHTWESQFKFLPIYRRTWESLGTDEPGR